MEIYYSDIFDFVYYPTKLIPLNITLPRNEMSLGKSLPGPMMKWLSTTLDQVAEATTTTEQQNKLQRLYALLEFADWSAGIYEGLFSIANSELTNTMKIKFMKCYGSDEKVNQTLRMLYGYIRGHNTSRKFSCKHLLDENYKNELEPIQFLEEKHWIQLKYKLNTEELRLENLNENIKNVMIRKLTSWPWYSLPYVGPLISEGKSELDHKENKIFWINMRFNSVRFIENHQDGVRKSNKIYAERVYSPIPLDLLETSSLFCLVNSNSKLSANLRYSWGVVPWFQPLSKELNSIINDHTEVKKYERIDQLQWELKQFGSTSSLADAKKMAEGIDLASQVYYGTCDLSNYDQKKNLFHLHILTGNNSNSLYIDQNSVKNDDGKNAWDFFNSAYQELGDDSIIYSSFQLEIEEAGSHCILVPQNLEKICRSCFQSSNQFTKNYPSLCEPCLGTLRGTTEDNLKRHLELLHLPPDFEFDEEKKRVGFSEKTRLQIKDWKETVFWKILGFYFPSVNLDDEWSLYVYTKCSDCDHKIDDIKENDFKWIRKNVSICKDCRKERWDGIRKSHIGPQGDFIMNSIFSVYKRRNKHLLIGHTELDEEAEVLTIYLVNKEATGLLIGQKGALIKALKDIIKFRVAINVEDI